MFLDSLIMTGISTTNTKMILKKEPNNPSPIKKCAIIKVATAKATPIA